MRPRALDLFCGAGGASAGIASLGFDVVGVDLEPQPNYPFEFVQADACAHPLDGFDFIWASPPCQKWITGGLVDRSGLVDLIAPIRERLLSTTALWVIENVPGAPLRRDALLCGSMFGLQVRRHRVFETSGGLILTPPCYHREKIVGVYGNTHGSRGAWPGMLPGSLETWSEAMGIDWMTSAELAQAIPPAYSAFLVKALI